MRPSIGILALGAANRASISAAIERSGGEPIFIDSLRGLRSVDAIVVPGVAHFGYLVSELDRRELREPLIAAIASGTPYLGICAGFQLLFHTSAEAPSARGLGVFAGDVVRIGGDKSPHMGWNEIEPVLRGAGITPGWAYFAHEYAAAASIDEIAARTTYGRPFASAAAMGAVLGVQFHPERSGAYGARILSCFIEKANLLRAR